MKFIECKLCGKGCVRRGPTQRYCEECSTKRDLERKKVWAKEHYTPDVRQRAVANARRAKPFIVEAGIVASGKEVRSIDWGASEAIPLLWMVRISVPFTYAASKNHLYTSTPHGHVALRREAVSIREAITLSLSAAMGQVKVVQNKVWLDIFVQKKNQRGDAVNFVDLVCDGVKRAMPVDDRWFSIRRLDWQVVKSNPKIFIGVGQDSDVDSRVCSHCGIIKPFDCFPKHKHTLHGIGRACRECLKQGRILAKAAKSDEQIDRLTVQRLEVLKGGAVEVEIERL